MTPQEDYRTIKKSLAERQSEMRARTMIAPTPLAVLCDPPEIAEIKRLRIFKESVRNQSTYALKRGIIKAEPCEVCGNTNSEKHHDDYDKPLEVRWLCKRHHGRQHAGRKKKALLR